MLPYVRGIEDDRMEWLCVRMDKLDVGMLLGSDLTLDRGWSRDASVSRKMEGHCTARMNPIRSNPRDVKEKVGVRVCEGRGGFNLAQPFSYLS